MRDIVGMRNRLIHTYEVVDLDLVWDVATRELAPLVVGLTAALQAERNREGP